jgi:hypothetical protein
MAGNAEMLSEKERKTEMTSQETFVNQCSKMRDMVERIRAMKLRRAIVAYCRAFGNEPQRDSSLSMCVIHNSLVARENGQPWREVDYSQMRLASRLANDYHASTIYNEFYQRKFRELFR